MKKTALLITILILTLTVVITGCTSDTSTPSTDPSNVGSTSPTASASPSDEALTTPADDTSAMPTSSEPVVTPPSISATDASGEQLFTLDELSTYDGKNGNLAYVAVDGVVYDVTDAPQWSTGSHEGLNAGTDLTVVIGTAPHGTDVLENVPVVGKLQ